MATIVLVHGIAQEQRSADSLEAEWLPDLAGGIRNAGHPALADRIWRSGLPGAEITARMAFYGHRFLRPGAQGATGDDLTPSEEAAAEEVAWELLYNAADSTQPQDSGEADLELRALTRGPQGEQGVRAAAGRVISAIDRISWLTQAGLYLSGRINKALRQIVQYLTDEATREYALQQVRQLLTFETRIVIGHSLGSVVAYEVVHELPSGQHLPLLVTLGSPLGLSSVNHRLRYPPSYPPAVARWVNLADRNDVVAARPNLHTVFDNTRPPGTQFDSTYTPDNGAQPHRAGFYLTKKGCGQPVAENCPGTVGLANENTPPRRGSRSPG